jgi:hypothetical protein
MERVLTAADAQTALDLGANAGFFTFSMAERGILCVAVEDDPTFVRTIQYVRQRVTGARVGVLSLRLDPATVNLLPAVDVTVFFSLWHHFVRSYGLEAATDMLARIWTGTRRALFFDTGESEMPAAFNLPAMGPTPREWLSGYLADVCTGGDVTHLGMHGGFYRSERNLFAVTRGQSG